MVTCKASPAVAVADLSPLLVRADNRRLHLDMAQFVRFTDLPFELSAGIVLLAARTYAVDDNQTVASLSSASRAIHALVQPVLLETVTITAANLSRIRAAVHTFGATTRLIVDVPSAEYREDFTACAAGFPTLEMFFGTIAALNVLRPVSNPSRIVLTDDRVYLFRLFPPKSSATPPHYFSRLTHARLTVLPALPRVEKESWPHLSCVSYLMLDVCDTNEAERFVSTQILTRIVPAFLALPTLKRLCLRLYSYRRADSLRQDLTLAAQTQRETRLWVDMEQDSAALEHRITFDTEHWLRGEQLFVA